MKRTIPVVILLALFASADLHPREPDREYQIKAGLLPQFILFSHWPETALTADNFVIGILGENPFGNMFDEAEKKPFKGKPLEVRFFGITAELAELKECHLLFICASVRDDAAIRRTITLLKDFPVLTVSEEKTKKGVVPMGMINFVLRQNKIRFEINRGAANRAGIKLSSKLLRVAVRVIE